MLLAQPPGELVEGQGGDLERGQAQAQGGLDVGAGEIGHLLEQGRPDQLQEGALLLQRGAALDAAPVPLLGQQSQPGPDAGLQLGVDEAQLGHQVGDEGGVAGVGLVTGQVVELAGAGEHEGLDDEVGQADLGRGLGQHFPVVAAGLHAQDQAGQLVAPLELAGPAHQRAHAVGRGRDAEPAQAGLVASADEHDHRLPPGQVDAGDERVRGDQLSTALQLGGPAAHASGYLHVEPLLFGVDQFRILEGLTDDRNAGARTRAVEMPGCGQARIGLAATRGFGAGLTTALGQPHGVAHIPTAPAAADFNLIRRLRRAISAMRT